MEHKYATEIEEFHRNFDRFKGQKIVLYGIGRMTATLLENVKDHSFIGLMDKDADNIGKTYFGLPVLSPEEARNQADLIMINTSGTYWNVIYRRIKLKMGGDTGLLQERTAGGGRGIGGNPDGLLASLSGGIKAKDSGCRGDLV